MIDLASALRKVVGELEATQTPYVVVGSTAAAAWGVARTTRDVDIVVAISGMQGTALLAALADTGLYIPVTAAHEALTTGGSFNVVDTATGGKVDVFTVGIDDPFTASRIDRRLRADVLGVSCWVASAEDVVLAKLRWRLQSQSEVQWRDCIEIVAVNDLDVAYLRRWAPELGVGEDLDRLLSTGSPPL